MEYRNQAKSVNARDLININRLDIIAKYKYVENRLKKIECNFFEKLYIKTIEAHTNGTFLSIEHKDKKGIGKFFQYFDNTIESITRNGFNYDISKITLDKNGVILDGGHRISILAYLNEKVTINNWEEMEIKDDPEEFKKRLLEEKYIDYLVSEYYRLTKKAFIVITTKEIDVKEKLNLVLIYKKAIKLNYMGINNIQKIVSQKNNVTNFNGKKQFYLYIVENDSESKEICSKIEMNPEILNCIQEREKIEAIIYMLLNKNSINFLNTIKLDNYENVNFNFEKIKSEIKQKGIDINDVIISRDITSGMQENFKENIELDIISMMPLDKCERKKELSELIYNPDNYIYFKNIKLDKKKQINLQDKYKVLESFKKMFHKIRILKRNLYFRLKLQIKEMVGKK